MEIESIFLRAWRLLCANWLIVVPGLTVGLITGITTALVSLLGNAETPPSPLASAIGTAISLVASIVSASWTTGMANAAWRHGKTTFADGGAAFARTATHVCVAIVGLFVLGAIAGLLAPFTLTLSLVAYVYLAIYTIASVVVGERNGIAAIVESVLIAVTSAASTVFMVAGLMIVVLSVGALATLLHALPFVGPLVTAIVVQGVVAYLTLVIVGEYRVAIGLGSETMPEA